VSETVLQRPDASGPVVASAAAIVGTATVASLQAGLLGMEAFRALAISQVVQGVTTGAGMVIGASVWGINGALVGLSVASIVAGGAAAVLVNREAARLEIQLSWRPQRDAWRSMWRLAAPALVAFVVVYAALLAGQTILARQRGGFEELAVFNLAYRWHLALLFVPAAISPALLPVVTRLLAHRESELASRLVKVNLWVTCAVTVPPAALAVLFAGQIMGLSGTFYSSHVGPLAILAVASIPAAINGVLSSTSLSAGRIRAWLVSDIALAVGLFVTMLALVAQHGAQGLAFAYLVGYLLTDLVLGGVLRAFPDGHRVSEDVPHAGRHLS
jgi:O-antigen/teichoic acid export membrane protein